MGKTAVFIGMMSIQKYIFASNKLKENIGASYIVKDIFKNLEEFAHSYIGGGNALIYFDSLEEAKDAMKDWSRTLLQSAPGIIPNITIDDTFDDNNYSESRTKLIRKAKMQENRTIPQTELGSFGITTDCPRSGLSAEIWGYKLPKNEEGYISSANYTKISASEKSNAELQEEFGSVIGDFKFTDEMDKLGGSAGENNHIAIVHIDGNDLGKKFKEEANEEGVKAFSTKLEEAVENAFKQTLKELIKLKSEDKISFKENYLPVRPIVIGGDDITFVCDARVGMFLTVEFIKAFENQGICKEKSITACAGISIVKTKYPFYRAYKMAEALCKNAKMVRKESRKEEGSSFIDFHISFGGLGGSLEEIRDANYKSADGQTLYMRPYSINNMQKLLGCLTEISELPQSNIKKLREALYDGETATVEFIKELEYRYKKLPFFSHSDESIKGFSNGKSPYIDMIELIDFYPKNTSKSKTGGDQ
ncbi:Cas10/Cmr2 second palm domain-containing protein [Candidatus Acidulodesulfobacterium sp. H_13]|uniref:Cas10/Cmr2 second palm domain-containing protein n=1 Tax=Candidatus Acidulodesulfobacterium sp. H_13 TaxID=3395470 RepID=UPI003AF4E4C6